MMLYPQLYEGQNPSEFDMAVTWKED